MIINALHPSPSLHHWGSEGVRMQSIAAVFRWGEGTVNQSTIPGPWMKMKNCSHQHSHLRIIWREWSQETVTYFLHFYWISRCQRVYCKMKPFKTRSTNNINYFLFRAIIKINFTLPLSLSPLPPLCVSLPPESISFSFHTLSDCHSLTV